MSAEVTTFYFRAGTPLGEVFTGELRALSDADAIQQLRRKGFRPLRIADRPIRDSWLNREVNLGGGRTLRPAQAESFCRELALLLRSGVPVVDALAVVATALPRRSTLKTFVTAVRHGVQLGRPFSEAIGSAGYQLPADLVPVVQAGETSSTLVDALEMLAASYAEGLRFWRAFASAAAYPVLLLAVSVVVFGLLALFVAPSLSQLFVSMDRPVPLPLAILSAVGAVLTQSGALGLWLAVLVVAALVAAGGVPGIRRSMAGLLASVPLIGSALSFGASRRFVSTLRLHLASHVPLAAALPGAFKAAAFPGGEARAAQVVTKVRAGARLGAELRTSRLIPEKLIHLIEVGESTGRLEHVLGIVADEAGARFEQRMAMVTSLLAPVLILVVGAVIGGVIFSVFSALLEINQIAF